MAEAKNKLPERIKAVEKHGGHGNKIELGMFEGIIVEKNREWWKPMTDQEVEAFLDGRY